MEEKRGLRLMMDHKGLARETGESHRGMGWGKHGRRCLGKKDCLASGPVQQGLRVDLTAWRSLVT